MLFLWRFLVLFFASEFKKNHYDPLVSLNSAFELTRAAAISF